MKDNPVQEQHQRVVRAFISSTFRDMIDEREELVKRIFPQLRKLCEQRGITWGEVDLRWGITDEQKAEGKVLPICLAEILGCRPYFIGILGQRYGWIPVEIPGELIEREPWLEEHRERSVTELEILQGVLNNPEMAGHAFFYFRDPVYIESMPPYKRIEYIEGPDEDEIENFGIDEAKKRAVMRTKKLEDLKQRIRESTFPVRENYKNPRELGELILKDFTELINRLFPEGTEPDPLEKDAAEHEAYARLKHKVYIGREEYFNKLNKQVEGDGLPIVVLGESGSGKSAFLANWIIRYRDTNPDDTVIMHFIGATPYSADWASMIRRVMGELKRRFKMEEDIPTNPEDLRKAFARWLHIVAKKSRVVMVLDALNQLEDRDNAPDLIWLPPVIPGNVRLVLSTLPGRPLDELRKRGWQEMEIKPLELNERKQLLREYLAQYRKTLSETWVDRIASAKQARNPLYLRALLEELRVFGVHEELDERINYYMAANTVPELFEKILERYEHDYDRDCPGMVRDAMKMIWASRRGLSESELLDLLGTDESPIPHAFWAPLYLAAEKALISRSGMISFSHDYLRQAIVKRYLPKEKDKLDAHRKLADYFSSHELNSRVLDELPWQYCQGQSWLKLYDLLSDNEFFKTLWEENEYDVKRYWAKVEDSSSFSLLDAYKGVIEKPDEIPDKTVVIYITTLLADTSHPKEADTLYQFLEDYYRKSKDKDNLLKVLNDHAGIKYLRLGNFDEAMKLLTEQEKISKEAGNVDFIIRSINGQAIVNMKRGELDVALELLEKHENMCRDRKDLPGVLTSLNNQALILSHRNEIDKALKVHQEIERMAYELGDPRVIHITLGNQAELHRHKGNLDTAEDLVEKKESICRDIGDLNGIGTCLNTKALILLAREDYDGAIELRRQEEKIFRQLDDPVKLQRSIGNLAAIIIDHGNSDEAIPLLKEQEELCRKVGLPAGLAICLSNQAEVLAKKGKPKDALPLVEEAYKLIIDHDFKEYEAGTRAVLEHIKSQVQ